MNRVDGINLRGFSPPMSVSDLHQERCKSVTTECGVYVVLRRSEKRPSFYQESTAGHYKGKDPSYPYGRVKSKWVSRAAVMYIGKTKDKDGLRKRIRDLVDFGFGRSAPHRGGRMLWHLKDWKQLQVRWRSCPRDQARFSELQMTETFRRVTDRVITGQCGSGENRPG